jgi:hypothetical protein
VTKTSINYVTTRLSAVVISYHHTGHGEVVRTRRPLSLCCR